MVSDRHFLNGSHVTRKGEGVGPWTHSVEDDLEFPISQTVRTVDVSTTSVHAMLRIELMVSCVPDTHSSVNLRPTYSQSSRTARHPCTKSYALYRCPLGHGQDAQTSGFFTLRQNDSFIPLSSVIHPPLPSGSHCLSFKVRTTHCFVFLALPQE